MDLGAFDVEAFPGTARRSSQRLFASGAARKKQWVIASIDITMAFLKGLTYQELAEATGGKKNVWCVLLCRLDQSTACSACNQARVLETHRGLSH
eukprot:5004150-Pyramimonas_sp.AAC.1